MVSFEISQLTRSPYPLSVFSLLRQWGGGGANGRMRPPECYETINKIVEHGHCQVLAIGRNFLTYVTICFSY